MRADFALTVGELKAWLDQAGAPDDAVVKLNVSGHCGDAMGHTLGFAPDSEDDRVLVITADEQQD